jgi:hypothetical protein
MELDGASSGGLIRSLAFAGPVALGWWGGLVAAWTVGTWWGAAAWALVAGPVVVLAAFLVEAVVGRWLVGRGRGTARPAVVWAGAERDDG